MFKGSMYFWVVSMSGEVARNGSGMMFEAVVFNQETAEQIEKLFNGGGWARYRVDYTITGSNNFIQVTAVEFDPNDEHDKDLTTSFMINTNKVIYSHLDKIEDQIRYIHEFEGPEWKQDPGKGTEPPKEFTYLGDEDDDLYVMEEYNNTHNEQL